MHGARCTTRAKRRRTLAVVRIMGVAFGSLVLVACGRHLGEGKPTPGPNVAVAKAYLAAGSRPGVPIRAYGCRIGSPVPLLFYVILLPNNETHGMLLIYSPPFNLVPRVQAATFDAPRDTWRLQELPDTDWSFQHLTALKLEKYGSDNRSISAEFNRIMAAHPAFSAVPQVDIATLIYSPTAKPWLTTMCP